MKARWQAFKKRHWDGRAARERRAIALATLGLSPFLAYFLLWQPAYVANKKLRVAIPAMRAQAAHLRTQMAEVEMLNHRPHPAILDATSLRAAVEASSLRHKMRDAISSLDAQEPNAVRVTLASVSFEEWVNWLRVLQQEQHIRPESVGIAALTQPGMVKISATLTNGETH